MVLVTRENKRRTYLHLLQEGVIVIKKDWKQESHEELKGIPNLHVHLLLRSLKDRDLVNIVFNWQYSYYFIKDNGVTELRKALGISEQSIAPKTFKKEAGVNYTGRDEQDEQAQRRQRGNRFGDRRQGAGRGRQTQETPAEQQQEEQTAQE
ncbi:hypothetical protein PPERSA_10955 [Pseudocohnilembus persalinus]|uniref:Plectin/eS10 N-terminal domain-containing protein n=1 Tax=Pseudocohnilembus persalinus TaxID=266149 RepID=A0A0V0QC61_PSEPJ|nr:hypothetical protein PPERSA_10955 [Pseudocohnilembus persalinus]|eukprot:KRW99836.1 hypothetical protein PPERSA_10955 [Pseudocohnilembus persalinus]